MEAEFSFPPMPVGGGRVTHLSSHGRGRHGARDADLGAVVLALGVNQQVAVQALEPQLPEAFSIPTGGTRFGRNYLAECKKGR